MYVSDSDSDSCANRVDAPVDLRYKTQCVTCHPIYACMKMVINQSDTEIDLYHYIFPVAGLAGSREQFMPHTYIELPII